MNPLVGSENEKEAGQDSPRNHHTSVRKLTERPSPVFRLWETGDSLKPLIPSKLTERNAIMNHVSPTGNIPPSVTKLLQEAFPQHCHFTALPDWFLPMYQLAILDMEKKVCPFEIYRFCKELTELIFQGSQVTSIASNKQDGIFMLSLERLDDSGEVVRSTKTWNEVVASAILIMSVTAEAYWEAVGYDDV